MKTITPADFARLLREKPESAVIDVRTPGEFATVHVPQAVNEPIGSLQPNTLAAAGKLAKDQPVYLLCQSGGRASKAAELFAREGFTDPVVVEGGTVAWVAADLPVVRGTAAGIDLERQVRIVAGSMVLIGVLLSQFVHPGFVWFSAFVGAGLVFAGLTGFCGMGLLLAKMPWNVKPCGCSCSGH